MKKLWIWLLAAALLITGCAVQGNTARAAGSGDAEQHTSGFTLYLTTYGRHHRVHGYDLN